MSNWILEKHISKKALANENITSWIKWDPKLVPKNIVLKFDSNIVITKVLNVNKKVLKNNESHSGKIILDQKHILIPGFFGFTCLYNTIPEKEMTVGFIAEFDFGNVVKKVEYSTKIIRPLLKFEQTKYSLTSSQFINVTNPLALKLVNTGLGRIVNLRPFAKMMKTNDIEIKIETRKENIKDQSLIFVKTEQILISKIIVNGVGSGMLFIGYEYKDAAGNSYKSEFANISVHIEEKQTLQIPLTENISKLSAPLLKVSVAP